MSQFFRRLIASICLLGITLPLLAAEPVRIGVLAFRPKPQTLAQWQPLAGVLKQAMPEQNFVVEAFDYPELEAAITRGELDFVLTNPGHYVLLAHRNGLSAPLATLISKDSGLPLSDFGGVIFTLAQRADIRTLADLRGKTLATIGTGSLGGYQMQAHELARAGIRLPQDASPLTTGMPHDQVVSAVLTGRADAGFVRSGVLESMVREGRLDLNRLKILNRKGKSSFPQLVSTRLYPEWPFASLPNTDKDLARRVAAALFMLEKDAAAARAMGIQGFTVPADYTPVEDLLRELRQPPFEAAPAFTLQDVSARYQWQIFAGVIAGGLILLLAIRLILVNRRLAAARTRDHLLVSALEAVGNGVVITDTTAKIEWANTAFEPLTGYKPEEALGLRAGDLIRSGRQDQPFYADMWNTILGGEVWRGEVVNRRKDGSLYDEELTIAPVKDENGVILHFVGVKHDITERKQNEERIRHMAQYDVLTDLPNRALLSDRLQQAIAAARRDGTGLALMLIDLDKFKPINDTLGHDVGDLLLKEVASRIRDCVRESDTVARIGGDEFVVLLRTVAHEPDAKAVAEKIRSTLNQPFELAGHRLGISSSTGIALYPEHGSSEVELAKHADIAMYHAKGNGRDNVQVFQPEMLDVQDAA
ncbi:MAG: diguanylate cyclase [Sulfuricella sp.]